MTAKTDKNFIYDYLIHLDSFLLHGVSEIGAPPKTLQVNESIAASATTKSDATPFQNKSSPIAFVVSTEGKQDANNVFNQDELELFVKIVASMGLSPTDIYVTSAPRETTPPAENIESLKSELSNTNCKYVICLGREPANYLTTNIHFEAYHSEEVWQSIDILQNEKTLVIIPSISEMLLDARHKKAAWAQLKKIIAQINDSI